MDILNEENIRGYVGIIIKNNGVNHLPRPRLKINKNNKNNDRFYKKINEYW